MKKSNQKIPYLLSFLFFTSLGFGQFYIDVGFAIKPYMISTALILIYILLKKSFIVGSIKTREFLFLIFLFIVGLSSLWSEYPVQTIRFSIGAFFLAITFFTLRSFFSHSLRLELIERSMLRSSIVVIIANLFYYILGLYSVGFNFTGNALVSYGLVLDRGSPRLIGTASSDPNITALIISIFLFFLLSRKGMFLKIASTFLIILTFSRGAIVSIFATLIVFFLVAWRRLVFTKKQIMLVVVAVLMMSIFVLNFSTNFNLNIIEVATSRTENVSSDQGSGRASLWADALNTFSQHSILGIGANSSVSYNQDHYNSDHYVHNTYLEVLSELGLLGMIIYVLLVLMILHNAYAIYKNTRNAFPLLLVLGFLSQIIFLSMMIHEMLLIIMVMLTVYGSVSKKGNNT